MDYKKLENYELSNDDIDKLLGSTKIIRYPDLQKYTNIKDLFDKDGRCVIFFETTDTYTGHWECMFMYPDTNIVQFFDSYGLEPDFAEKYINKYTAEKLKETKPYLNNLFEMNSKYYEFYCNTVRYQQMVGDVSTCGKHVSVRLLHNHLNDDEYYMFMNEQKKSLEVSTFDEVVTNIIFNLIGK
jgi:hypothetical protein